jgi:aminopeptidase N
MAIAEITRAETAARVALLRVDSYEVELDLARGAELFGSTSLIRFSCNRTGASTYVDLIAEKVHEITLNGAAVDPAAAFADGRIALSPLADANELRVVAGCRYSSDGTGLHRAVDSADGKVYTYTKFEPAYARRVYANFEQPDLKSRFTFHVKVPARWTVLSNQPSPYIEALGEETSVWHFPPTPQISTYLTAVAAGDYHVVQSSHTTPRGQVVPLGLACPASLAGSHDVDVEEVYLLTRQGLDFYTELFEGDYPFAKYDQVFVPEYSAGATENVGCVIITDQLLFRSRVTDAMREVRAMVILHEMAHMWFGDLVTMRWWDDLWLNESFAEYCGTLSSAEATRFTDAWTTFSCGRKTWGYMQDQLPSTHPIAADVPTLTQAVANFDGISYAKGASVLRQLIATVGNEQFLAAIRAYFAEHAWGNATLADLLGAVEASSGMSLMSWSKAWLQTAGPNTLRSDFDVDEAGEFTSFAVLQEAPVEYPTLRPHHIAVALYNLAEGVLSRTHRSEVKLEGARTEITQLAGVAQPDLILLNDDDLDYAIIRFDPRSVATLEESIGLLTDSLARAVCWSAAIDMVDQAELSLPAFVRMLAGNIGREPSLAMLAVLQSAAAQSMAMLGDPEWVPEGKGQLAAVAVELLHAAGPGSDHQLCWAQLLSWTAASQEQLGLLSGLLGGGAEIGGLAVDADLRWAFLRRLVTKGGAGDAEIEAELRRDATDNGKRHAAACRAAVPDAEHKAAAWHLLTDTEELGAPGVMETSSGFNQPEHADLLAPYADRYFEALPVIWSTRSEHLRALLGTFIFPYPAASEELLARIDSFLAEERDPGMGRVVIERRDIVARALRSRRLPVT